MSGMSCSTRMTKAFPSPIPFCPAMSPLALRRCLHNYFSLPSSCADAGFAHQIGARPSLFTLFTKLPVRSLSLQPGRLRHTLSDVLSSRLVHCRFQLYTDSSLRGSQSLATIGT